MKLYGKILLVAALLTASLSGVPARAADPGGGKAIYVKRCAWCHGDEGAGDGPASEYLNPPPRDFTEVSYKFKSTPFEEMIPTDGDLLKVIRGRDTGKVKGHGPGWTASMPGFGDILSVEDARKLIAYIKYLSDIIDEPVPEPISLEGRIPVSGESIRKGKELFEERERCTECHGRLGKGDGRKRLKDDLGYRTWPRNLTKGFSFRGGSMPEDIYTRLTVGIPGTQMPSFADPASRKRLTEEDRWHVANYVASLDEPYKKPGDSTTIHAAYLEGPLPDGPLDDGWKKAPFTSLHLFPQIIEEPRLFTPSLDSLSVKALYNRDELSILIEWDDRTQSNPNDKLSREMAGGEHYPDAAAVEFPEANPSAGKSSTPPYFGEGDTEHPVNIWYWRGAGGVTEETGGGEVKLFNATGSMERKERKPGMAGVRAKGVYQDGTWRVSVTRPLRTDNPDTDIQFDAITTLPVAFALWDGSNLERASKHVLTSWHKISFKQSYGYGRIIWPAAVGVFIFILELAWLRGGKEARRTDDPLQKS